MQLQDVSRDGQRFLFIKRQPPAPRPPPPTEIRVIVNWIEIVKQKLGAAAGGKK